MTRYMKIWSAVMLFCMSVLMAWNAYQAYLMSLPDIWYRAWGFLAFIALILVPVMLLWAEGTDPYRKAEREHRRALGYWLILKQYADGLRDDGELARRGIGKGGKPREEIHAE